MSRPRFCLPLSVNGTTLEAESRRPGLVSLVWPRLRSTHHFWSKQVVVSTASLWVPVRIWSVSVSMYSEVHLTSKIINQSVSTLSINSEQKWSPYFSSRITRIPHKMFNFTFCFAFSVVQKACVKTHSLGNQPLVMSQRALISFYGHLVFDLFRTCLRPSKASVVVKH